MFDTPYSFGVHRMLQDVQTAPYVEDRRWDFGPVTYATLNIPGSDNNLTDTNPDPTEYAARNTATIAWMRAAFDEAEAHGSDALMLVMQANPGFDRFDSLRAPARDPQTLLADLQPPDPGAGNGYDQFLLALRAEIIDFAKPVVLVTAIRTTSASTSHSSTATATGSNGSRGSRRPATAALDSAGAAGLPDPGYT